MNNSIVTIAFFANNIQYISPNGEYIKNKKIVNEIKEAWDKSCAIDENGHIWLTDVYLHTIFRTSKDNAKYYVQQIEKEHKRKESDLTYIKGSEIIRVIDDRLQTAGVISKENNLRLSSEMYSAIRDSDTAKLLRYEYYENIKNYVKKLKQLRIMKFDLCLDELTGDLLDKKNSEFSHIRSCSIYPYLMDNICNGLVVNKNTHELITKLSINDENQLYDLCKEMKWHLGWYESYIDFLRAI